MCNVSYKIVHNHAKCECYILEQQQVVHVYWTRLVFLWSNTKALLRSLLHVLFLFRHWWRKCLLRHQIHSGHLNLMKFSLKLYCYNVIQYMKNKTQGDECRFGHKMVADQRVTQDITDTNVNSDLVIVRQGQKWSIAFRALNNCQTLTLHNLDIVKESRA